MPTIAVTLRHAIIAAVPLVACGPARRPGPAAVGICARVGLFFYEAPLFGSRSLEGALVRYVVPGRPAAVGGIRRFDRIVKVGEQEVTESHGAGCAIRRLARPGACLAIALIRGASRILVSCLRPVACSDTSMYADIDEANRLAATVEIFGLVPRPGLYRLDGRSLAAVAAEAAVGSSQELEVCVDVLGPLPPRDEAIGCCGSATSIDWERFRSDRSYEIHVRERNSAAGRAPPGRIRFRRGGYVIREVQPGRMQSSYEGSATACPSTRTPRPTSAHPQLN